MISEKELQQRSDNKCELCGNSENLSVFEVPNSPINVSETTILICETCKEQIENPEKIQPNHWRCLNESMWSSVPAVQVMAWRMLNTIKTEGWPQDLLDMMYLDEETTAWAKAGTAENNAEKLIHRDSNGVILEAGD